MKRLALGLLQILCIVLILVVAAIYSRAPTVEEVQSQTQSLGHANESVLVVNVLRPELRNSQLSVQSTGTVTTRNTVALIPQVTGQVVWTSDSLRTGGAFDADQELLRIEKSDFELTVEQAEANLQTAEANLELREAESSASIENWKLLHSSEQVPDLVAKVPQIAQSRANVAVAKANLEIARLSLSRTVYKLPFSGKVLAAEVGVGQLLTRGQPFGSVYDNDALEVQVNISEAEYQRLVPAIGRNATVGKGTSRFQATVQRTSADVDMRSRVSTLFLVFTEPSDFVPGNFVEVELFGRKAVDTYHIPESAEHAHSTLWIVREGKMELVEPQIVARDANGIIVSSFDYADGIVVGSLSNAYPGMQVAIAVPQS